MNLEAGAGNYSAPGLWTINLAQNPDDADQTSIGRAQGTYLSRRQIVQTGGLDETHFRFITAPYRRAMAMAVDYPSPEFIKAMLMVKVWLDDAPSLAAGKTKRHYDQFDTRAGCRNHIVRTFFPMFIMAPTRTQKDDGGILEWAIQSIKYAWYRMHVDFTQGNNPASTTKPVTPTFIETKGRYIATGPHQGTDEPSTWTLNPRSLKNSKEGMNKNHPYRTCTNLRQFRSKYGMTVLIYGSAINEEQKQRVATNADKYAGAGGSTSDDRIISVTFDPAHPQNRLASYGDPSPLWQCFHTNPEVQAQFVARKISFSFVVEVPVPTAAASKAEPPPNEKLSYALRNMLPVSPEGVKLPFDRKDVTPNSWLMTTELSVPGGDEYEDLKVWLSTDERREKVKEGMTSALRHDFAEVTDVRAPLLLDKDDDVKPEEVFKTSPTRGAGAYVYVGPRVALGNMIPEGEAHRVRTYLEDPGDPASKKTSRFPDPQSPYASDPIEQRYVFTMADSPDAQPRLPYLPDLSNGEGAAIESPLENLNGIVPKVSIATWTSAESAVQHFEEEYGIVKVMAAGYNMFQAGTTLQVSAAGNCRYAPNHQDRDNLNDKSGISGRLLDGPTDLNWIPKYMALATTEAPSIDVTYQMLGRCFVDLGADSKGNAVYLPKGWKVELLGNRELIPAVDLYAKLELRFSQLEGMTLTGAIAHLAQFMKSTLTEIEDPSAIALMLKYSLGVENRLKGLYEFFKLVKPSTAAFPPLDHRDREYLAQIPPRNPDADMTGAMVVA